MAVDAKLTPDPYLYALNDPPLPPSIDKTMTGINIIVLTQEAEKALSDLAASLTDMKPALKAIGESLVESTNIGLRIPEAWARDKLKIPEPEGNEPVLSAQAQPAAPAAPPTGRVPSPAEQQATTQASALLAGAPLNDPDPTPVTAQTETLAIEGGATLKAMVDHIRNLTEQSATLEELRDNLLQAYGGFSHQELANVMAMAFAAADLSGRYDVQAGS